MDFSNAYLGKSLADLSYDDIVSFFNEPQQESENLEFKSYAERATFDTGLQAVIRGISAFLNSTGGLLIWGAPKGSKLEGRSEETFSGTLTPVKELIEKDRLINRISSAIVPLPVGINVNILSSESGYIYIFEVQQSIYKPHQYDTRYYVRLDGQTKPAPHYLVEALVKKISYPNLNGVIKFSSMRLEAGELTLRLEVGLFNFSEFQNEESVSFRLLCVGGYFQTGRNLYAGQHPWRYTINESQLIYEDFASVLHFGTPKTHTEAIIVNTNDLENNQGKLSLVLSFGGKSSPAKTSIYKLNLHGSIPSDPNKVLEVVEENVLFSDRLKQLNKTPKDTLLSYLGR